MKQFINQSIVLEVSQRELELIRNAAQITKQFWHDRADSTLEFDETMKTLRLEIADEYESLEAQANEILNNLPF